MDVLGAMKDTCRLAVASKMPSSGPLGYAHIAGMLVTMVEDPMDDDKANRWLGWAQCAVVASGAATLADMKKINARHK